MKSAGSGKRGGSKSKASSKSKSSRGGDPDDQEQVVMEVPSRRSTRLSSKKSKKDDDNRQDIGVTVTDPVSASTTDDKEDPVPVSQVVRKGGRGTKKKSKHVTDDGIDDDDGEPLSKSVRGKVQERKRKASVLSDSDSDEDLDPDDFNAKEETKKSRGKKPAVSVAVAKQTKANVSNASVKKRETKQKKVEPEPPKNSPKRSPKSPIPAKRESKSKKSKEAEKSADSSSSSSKPKKIPEEDKVFKVPTPLEKPKSQSRVKATSTSSNRKRSAPIDDDDDEDEEDFNPKKKAATSTKKGKAPSSSKKKGDKTPSTSTSGSGKKRELTEKQKESYKKYLATESLKPKNLGSKIIPIGAPNCLHGLTFVMSGILDSMEREDCKKLIEKYGGRVTGSVSRKTNYLIVGDEPGETKTKKAEDLKIPIIDEDGFLEILRQSNPNGNANAADFQDSGMDDFDSDDDMNTSSSSSVQTGTPSQTPTSPVKDDQDSMWVDKYRPKTLKTVVGQSGNSSNAKKLLKWLQNWFYYHGSSKDKVKAGSRESSKKDPEGKTFKAALLSGPPGVGKTTTAHLTVKEVGYDYYELNASDTRNKKGLQQKASAAVSSKALVFDEEELIMTRKHVLIMDELDGISGNEDRGGVQELLTLIKSSRVPVICICNDRFNPKIRTLANYCFDLRFYKPSYDQIRGLVCSVSFKENIKLPQQDKLHQLIISTDNDVRQVLHQLEFCKSDEGQGQGQDQAFNPKKDLNLGLWDVVRKVFLRSEHEKMSIHDRIALFFQDYQIGPLFVHENYLRWEPAKALGSRVRHLQLLANTASSLADGDMVENLIRRSQHWDLLPVQAVFQSYIPGEYMVSNTFARSDFPTWLGRNSNKNKRHRFLQTLHTHMHLQISGSLEALNMDYLPYLGRSITGPLIEGDIDAAAEVMENYTLLREDVDSITELCYWPFRGTKNPMAMVNTSTKSAFTRKINKEVMLPYARPVKGKSGGGWGKSNEDGLEQLPEMGEGEAGEGVVDEEEEEEEETLDKDGMVKVKNQKNDAAPVPVPKVSKKNASFFTFSPSGKGGKGGKKRSS